MDLHYVNQKKFKEIFHGTSTALNPVYRFHYWFDGNSPVFGTNTVYYSKKDYNLDDIKKQNYLLYLKYGTREVMLEKNRIQMIIFLNVILDMPRYPEPIDFYLRADQNYEDYYLLGNLQRESKSDRKITLNAGYPFYMIDANHIILPYTDSYTGNMFKRVIDKGECYYRNDGEVHLIYWKKPTSRNVKSRDPVWYYIRKTLEYYPNIDLNNYQIKEDDQIPVRNIRSMTQEKLDRLDAHLKTKYTVIRDTLKYIAVRF